MEKGTERLEEPEVREEGSRMVSSGHNRAVALMNAQHKISQVTLQHGGGRVDKSPPLAGGLWMMAAGRWRIVFVRGMTRDRSSMLQRVAAHPGLHEKNKVDSMHY